MGDDETFRKQVAEMTAKETALNDEIMAMAKAKLGAAFKEIKPILDGVRDIVGYLRQPIRVAWLLKEPYDGLDAFGRPCGGGWRLFTQDTQEKFVNDVAGSSTARNLAYVMYGSLNDLHWNDIPSAAREPMVAETVKQVAWLNVSKLPGYTSTRHDVLRTAYAMTWRPYVLRQLALYRPDVIVFAKTFWVMNKDFADAQEVPKHTNNRVRYLRHGDQVLLDTQHPSIKGADYVNALIEAIRAAAVDLGKPLS